MRMVIKIGTSTLAYGTGRLNIRRMEHFCKVVSDLINAGNEIILVSSGAIGLGAGKLNLASRPQDIPGKQAAAAVGQCELMYIYDKLFGEYNHTVAQLLLTAADVKDPARAQNFENALFRLLEMKALPIINENDTVATEEIVIGDNDTLAAIVAEGTQSKLLVLLSDINGFYTADPRKDPEARLISQVEEVTPELEALAADKGTSLGTGGMITKLKAAKIVTAAGCEMVIANGADPEILYDIVNGEPVGTRFMAKEAAQ